MRTIISVLFCLISSLGGATSLFSQELSSVVIFSEAGFPTADSVAASPEQLQKVFPGARFASAEQLKSLLADPATRLLVLPYSSAFPESSWHDISTYLHKGGNLLVLGGRPFTRAAYHDGSGWHLREYSVRFARQLMIDQYQTIAGAEGLDFISNPDVPVQLPRFSWKHAFSPVIRMSAVELYNRGGSAGSLDARLDALAWAGKDGRRLSAPIVQIDHLQNGFNGGRWIFVNAELGSDFYGRADAPNILLALARQALQGSLDFSARPTLPLYLPGEPVEVQVLWRSFARSATNFSVKISSYPEKQVSHRFVTTVGLPSTQPLLLPAPAEKGFHIIEAQLLEGATVRATYRCGFWIRDEAYLRSGPRLIVNRDFFELNGQPLAVVGTTYMASDSQRLYFEHPNAYVWDRDLDQIRSAGLNMVRTGWWTGWDKFCDEDGRPYERTLRTLEAFLMTARKYELPVQFNFFAFLPEVLRGVNPYLDPEAVRRQQTLISTVVARFHDVPFLAWDLINEPSFSKRLWTLRPNEDPIELARWNEWLTRRYRDRAALAAAWNVPFGSIEGTIPLPQEMEFTPRGMYVGRNSLKLYDYALFAQESFAAWAQSMREVIRATGSQQLITVGQDEGGYVDRLSPAFFGPAVDFTTNHSWWQNDSILWDSLVAKQPGQAMLIQETGLQRQLNMNESARLTPEQEGALFERKFALSFVQGSGAIEWLWNSNSYMTEGNETPIGAVRPDGTEKPEAAVLRDFAAFARDLQPHLRSPQQPPVAIMTSQAAQFSVMAELQVEAQRNAVRALAYHARLMPYVVAENQVAKLGSPKLVLLPSAQSLNESTWQALLKYVNDGGNLLITGPIERDEHWQVTSRANELMPGAFAEPLTYHRAELHLASRSVSLSFSQQKQSWLDSLRFKDGASFQEISSGKGKVYWAAYPVELAEGLEAAAELYRYVAGRAGLVPQFELRSTLDPGVLIHTTVLDDSVLYIFESEAADDAHIALRDKVTGAQLNLRLPSQHAALALVSKEKKTIIAKYGF